MARRFSLADAAACVAAGVGSWFTRASLDVVAVPGGEARVAMLPAPVELAGLVTLALLSGLLLRRALSRTGRAFTLTADLATSAAHLLFPFFAVLATAIPYAPWLTDLVPAWRALAGPARFALWSIVCGQVVWIAIDLAASCTAYTARAAHHPNQSLASVSWPVAVVLLVSVAAGVAFARGVAPDAIGRMPVPDGPTLPPGLRLSLGAIVSASLWLWTMRITGLRGPATLAWLAVAATTPFLVATLFTPTICVAAGCVIVIAGWPGGADDPRAWTAAMRGAALAALPWLAVSYVPFAAVLGACLAWRLRGTRLALMAAGTPLVLAVLAAVALHPGDWSLYGTRDSSWWSAAALFVGQQEGILLYAPSIALAAPGLRQLWRHGGAGRVAAVEAVLGTAAVLVIAGPLQAGGHSPSLAGAPLVPALPLLVPPIAHWLRRSAPSMSRMGLARLLVLWGIVAAASLVLAPGGIGLRGRGGASGLLEWLAPSRELVRVAPVSPVVGGDALAFVVSTMIWIAVAAGLWWMLGRMRPYSHGAAALIATTASIAGMMAGAAAVEAALGARIPARLAPGLRVDAPMLDGFDARRRPLAIVYDRWRTLPAADVPPLFSFEATPGARRYPQPVPVLLNMRLSLPAGDYMLKLRPRQGAALNGSAGLQVGRIGPPMRGWQIAAPTGAPWSAAFTLPVDASFVGLRTSREVESVVAAVEVQPARVVNGRDRHDLPAVLSSATYKDVIVTFHGDQVYPERDGFWVRGRSTLLATFAPPEALGRQPGVQLSLHGGAKSTHVRFETAAWSATVALEPGVPRELHVPALRGQTLLPVRITVEGGFVPAETHGGSDRRLLGCWIEVLE